MTSHQRKKYRRKKIEERFSATTRKSRRNFTNRFVNQPQNSKDTVADPLSYLEHMNNDTNDTKIISKRNPILDLADNETAVVCLPALVRVFGDAKAFRNGVPGGGPCGYHCLIRALISSTTGLSIAQTVFHITNKEYNIIDARKAFVAGLTDHTHASFFSLAGTNLDVLRATLMEPKHCHLDTMAISIFAFQACLNVVLLIALPSSDAAEVHVYGPGHTNNESYDKSKLSLMLYLRSNKEKTGGHYELIGDKDNVKLFSHENSLLQNVLGHHTRVKTPLRRVQAVQRNNPVHASPVRRRSSRLRQI